MQSYYKPTEPDVQPKGEFRKTAKEKLDALIQQTATKVVDMIEEGVAEAWEKTWSQAPTLSTLPYNPVSNHTYAGQNLFMLLITKLINRWEDPRFMTFNQAKKMRQEDGEPTHVSKGERGTFVLRPVVIHKNKTNEDSGQQQADDRDKQDQGSETKGSRVVFDELEEQTEEEDDEVIVYFKPYKVFNAEQIENCPPLETGYATPDWADSQMVENLTNLVRCCGIDLIQQSNKCKYIPSKDRLYIPDVSQFEDEAAWGASVLHEFFHATGHESRQDRFKQKIYGGGGLEDYAMEELRAESFSLIVSAMMGLPYRMTTSTAYLRGWRDKADLQPKQVVEAIADATSVASGVMQIFQGTQPQWDWFPDKSEWQELITPLETITPPAQNHTDATDEDDLDLEDDFGPSMTP